MESTVSVIYLIPNPEVKINIEIRNKNFNLPNRKSKITKEMLLMFDLEKFSNIKIAKELNVDEASIRRAKKRYNL